MLLCFIVALVILMIYSSKYFIALLAPVFYLILRLKNISAERTYLTDAICTVDIHDFGVTLSVSSSQTKLCETFSVLYSNIETFSVIDRKVLISFTDNHEKKVQMKTIEFHILPEDATFWMDLADKFSK